LFPKGWRVDVQRWNNAPELEGAIEMARTALVRTRLAFGLDEDLVSACVSLGTAAYLAYVRHDPDALKMIEDFYGPDAFARAFEYLSEHPAGFPREPIEIPRHRPRDNRMTPPEVRALWRICDAAVGETFVGLLPEVQKKLTLNLSWAMHNVVYAKHAKYREKIKEMRRIIGQGLRRTSGGFHIMPSLIAAIALGEKIAFPAALWLLTTLP
jgi:hypothetical protein